MHSFLIVMTTLAFFLECLVSWTLAFAARFLTLIDGRHGNEAKGRSERVRVVRRARDLRAVACLGEVALYGK